MKCFRGGQKHGLGYKTPQSCVMSSLPLHNVLKVYLNREKSINRDTWQKKQTNKPSSDSEEDLWKTFHAS